MLYVLVNVAYFLVVPLDEIKSSGEMIAALFFERVFGQSVGRTILPLAVAVSAAGVSTSCFTVDDQADDSVECDGCDLCFGMCPDYLGETPNTNKLKARLNQEIARQGFLPFGSWLSSSKPFNAPLGGLIVHYIPSFLVIVLPPSGNVYSFILEVEGYPAQFFVLAIAFGLIWLRYERRDLERPYKAWIPAVILRIALSLALLAAPFFPPPRDQRTGVFWATYAIVGTSM